MSRIKQLELRQEQQIFLFLETSRLVIQWVPEVTDHAASSNAEIKNALIYASTSPVRLHDVYSTTVPLPYIIATYPCDVPLIFL